MISGEKPRILEQEAGPAGDGGEADAQNKAAGNEKKEEPEKNTEKKKRKGVGYSSKQGQAFDVTAYLENTKQRNEQIRTLVDICSNFLGSKEWTASEEVGDIILESALLPLLEQAFRNGSWLDMAKAADVYASYLGKHSQSTILIHFPYCSSRKILSEPAKAREVSTPGRPTIQAHAEGRHPQAPRQAQRPR